MKDYFFGKVKSAQFVVAALIGIAAQGAVAATTTLTFDDIANGTNLSTEYQGVGVTASGATIIVATSTPWPIANTGLNVAYASSGLMTFNLNSSITGNVQSVSAYISGDTSTGLYAYDAGGSLVGQAVTVGAASNMLLSVTSSGNPIASVAIHDGGSSFTIDTLSFVAAPPVLTCTDVAQQLYNAVNVLPTLDFKSPYKAVSKRSEFKKEIAYFESLVARNASNSKLLNQLKEIQSEIVDDVKATTRRTNILNLIKQLIAMTYANQC
jgi:hypothetical protein